MVPYLAHRYLHQSAADGVGAAAPSFAKEKVLTFIGSSRKNNYRTVTAHFANESFARIGMKSFTESFKGNARTLAAWGYAYVRPNEQSLRCRRNSVVEHQHRFVRHQLIFTRTCMSCVRCPLPTTTGK